MGIPGGNSLGSGLYDIIDKFAIVQAQLAHPGDRLPQLGTIVRELTFGFGGTC
jgi:hypothetical protein